MNRYNVCKTPLCKAVHIQGSSLTIPGLAPDLQTLLAAAEQGELLPRVGTPMYDESEEAGQVRISVGDLPPEEILQNAQAKPEQPLRDKEPAEGSEAKEDKERSDADE